MKLKKLTRFGLIAVVALDLCPLYGQSSDAPVSPASAAVRLPSNAAAVAKLSSAGVGEDVVLAFVNSSRSYYSLSANDILQLKNQGVTAPVITAMLNHDNSLRNAAPPEQPVYTYSQRNYGQPGAVANAGQPGQVPTQVDPYLNAGQVAPQLQPAPAPAVAVQPAPSVQVEYIPYSPGPDYYYWAPGYWGWNNVWIGGGWNLGLGYRYRYGRGWGGYHGWGGFHGGFRGGSGFHGGGGFHSAGGFHSSGGFRGGHR